MLDISVIILMYNEEIHIRRYLENVEQFVSKAYVVDCLSIDRTAQTAEELGTEAIEHEWPRNQAEQSNRTLNNLPIITGWILHLGAGEYLLPGPIEELLEKLPVMLESVPALSLSRARVLCGKILHHDVVNNVRIIRIFRRGRARYEKRLMDEYLSILSGEAVDMKNQFADDNRMSVGLLVDKHSGCATREAALLSDAECHLTNMDSLLQDCGREAGKKRTQKARYVRMSLFWRIFRYFVYRYIIKFEFLDGKEGFLWDFL